MDNSFSQSKLSKTPSATMLEMRKTPPTFTPRIGPLMGMWFAKADSANWKYPTFSPPNSSAIDDSRTWQRGVRATW
jgi:hypothetical protein